MIICLKKKQDTQWTRMALFLQILAVFRSITIVTLLLNLVTLFCRKKIQIRQLIETTAAQRESLAQFLIWKKKVTRINLTNFLIKPERELHNFKMFKKFEEKESISGITQLKSSVQKGIRNKLKESYPGLEGLMDDFLPKKDAFKLVKCHDHLELLINSSGRLLFFRSYEGPWCPTLKLLHQYPFLLPQQRVDKGMVIKVRFWCKLKLYWNF